MLFDLVRDNLLTIKDAASQAKLTEEMFREKMTESELILQGSARYKIPKAGVFF